MNNSHKVITNQPIISYHDENLKQSAINAHKNSCEKWCTCNSTAERYPLNCTEFGNMLVMDMDRDVGTSYTTFGCYSCCCLPITLPLSSLLCGPCTLYNIARNKCAHNTEDKNYLC